MNEIRYCPCPHRVYSLVGHVVKQLVKEELNEAGEKILTLLTGLKLLTYLFMWALSATQQ